MIPPKAFAWMGLIGSSRSRVEKGRAWTVGDFTNLRFNTGSITDETNDIIYWSDSDFD